MGNKQTPIQLHAAMLKMALAGDPYEIVKETMLELGESEARINYVWNHGVVSPSTPSVLFLLNDRKMALALQEKQDRLDAAQRELDIVAKEREITQAMVKNRQQVNSSLENARLQAEREATAQMVESGKSVATLAMGQMGSVMSSVVERFSAVYVKKLHEWLDSIDNIPANFQMLKEGMILLKELTRSAKDAVATAKLAAEVDILLRVDTPTSTGPNSPPIEVIRSNPELIVALYRRHSERLGLESDNKVIDSEIAKEETVG